jgi:predicted dehydrogenase
MGHIGVGGMGGGHLGGYAHNKRLPTVAVCDVDEGHRVRAQKRVGSACDAYKDYRELLDRDDIHAVVIATPDHWHALTVIYAAEAGKDIYCEKPLSLTIREARAMVNAVRRYGRVFQTGSQQRSGREFRFACELVRNGYIGKIQTVNVRVGGPSADCYLPEQPVPKGLDWNMWLGPAPWRPYNRGLHPYNWRWFRDYSGGNMTDWGAHHFDIAQWGLGMDHSGPVEVHPPDGKEHQRLTYKYANGVVMFHGGGGGNGRGILFTGTKGQVEVDRGYLETWPAELKQIRLKPDDIRLRAPRGGHHGEWQTCMRTRERPNADIEFAARTITVCHMGNIAYWIKRPLKWDPVKEQFVGDAEANRWLDRPKRPPWRT